MFCKTNFGGHVALLIKQFRTVRNSEQTPLAKSTNLFSSNGTENKEVEVVKPKDNNTYNNKQIKDTLTTLSPKRLQALLCHDKKQFLELGLVDRNKKGGSQKQKNLQTAWNALHDSSYTLPKKKIDAPANRAIRNEKNLNSRLAQYGLKVATIGRLETSVFSLEFVYHYGLFDGNAQNISEDSALVHVRLNHSLAASKINIPVE